MERLLVVQELTTLAWHRFQSGNGNGSAEAMQSIIDACVAGEGFMQEPMRGLTAEQRKLVGRSFAYAISEQVRFACSIPPVLTPTERRQAQERVLRELDGAGALGQICAQIAGRFLDILPPHQPKPPT